MTEDHWVLHYQVPNEEFGWLMPQFERLEVPVSLTPQAAVEIERVFHRLSHLAMDSEARACRLEVDLEALQQRSLWAVLWATVRRGRR